MQAITDQKICLMSYMKNQLLFMNLYINFFSNNINYFMDRSYGDANVNKIIFQFIKAIGEYSNESKWQKSKYLLKIYFLMKLRSGIFVSISWKYQFCLQFW